MFLGPLLSSFDPAESAEGSIDPLGTYAIADALGVRLIPGVRERQQHIRFLTAMAVSLSICSEFEDDEVAADGVSEPWQVFEWYFVTGMERKSSPENLRGMPGRDKAATARKDGVPLSAKRYLKTPSVFGFHGVYRGLARQIGIDQADRLGEIGYRLLKVWEKEQGLTGFCGSEPGEGGAMRRRLVEAVRDGLSKGHVDRPYSWPHYQFFPDRLAIRNAGREEAALLQAALLDDGTGFRRQVCLFLQTKEAIHSWADVTEKERSERSFHRALAESAEAELKKLLDTIDVYERFSRLLQDSFDDTLERASSTKTRVRPRDMAELKSVRRAAADVAPLFPEIVERLSHFRLANDFRDEFRLFEDKVEPAEFSERLLRHHCQVQRSKPPDGKAPWFDCFDNGSFLIRTPYLRKEGGRNDDSYVHAYRTRSLWSFARDLKLVN